MIERKECIFCKHNKIKEIYSFRNFPVYMGVSDNDSKNDDIVSDMIFGSCEKCGCVQLTRLIDPEILYFKGHNQSIGKVWREHHNSFAEFIKDYDYDCSCIVEIGGSHLELANLLIDRCPKIMKYIVFDTNAAESENYKIKIKRSFFSREECDYNPDIIVHSHVLEHFYEPLCVLEDIYNILKVGDKMIMSVPLVHNMMADLFLNSMNFEHTYCLNESNLSYILSLSGFKINNIKHFNKYNVFLSCEKVDKSYVSSLDFDDSMVCVFNNFINFYTDLAKSLNDKLSETVGNNYLFGGHIFSQYLINFGLDDNLIECVLDNDPKKIGNRLYGTDLMVESPKILLNKEKPVVVLRAAQFSNEIKDDIIYNINKTSIFLEK